MTRSNECFNLRELAQSIMLRFGKQNAAPSIKRLRCSLSDSTNLISLFFFFKQKTAYEMRTDWSSDVCSSDLTGKRRDIYLDVVHELVHVRQFREGKQLFPEGFNYPDAPTEIEAYKVCIAEGRRLGMTDRE